MPLDLETISPTGAVPPSVIKDANSARTIFNALLTDDLPSNQMRAQIEGMVDGNAPFDDQELIDLGQAGRTNCNWGTARARINAAKQPHYDLLTSVSTFATVRTSYGGPALASAFSRIISEEMHRTLSDWDEFLEQMEIHQGELVTHGIGPAFWVDEKDWRFRALLRRNMLVPSNAKSSRNRQTLVFIRDTMEAHELFAYIQNPEVARATKWNVERCKRAIRDASTQEEDKARDWEWWQAQFKDNNYFISYAKTRTIAIIHCFAKELNGKVSHHIFTRNALGDNDGFIYSKTDRFEEMNQVIWMCFDGVGNGDFKSVRGLGNEVFHFGEASNRLNNSVVDGTIRSMCQMWQAETAADAQKFMAIEIGPDRLLPPGFSAVPMSPGMSGNVKSAIEVASYFQMMESSNTGGYRASMDSKEGNPITAREATLQASEKASMTSSKSEHYLRACDRLFREQYRRLSNPDLIRDVDPGANEALDFQKRCKERGVPAAALKMENIVSVRATRGIGNGSATGRIMAMQQLMPIVLTRSPEAQQKTFINDLIGALANSQFAVESYGIPLGDVQPGEEEWQAQTENNDFLMGGTVLFTPDQNHLVHATYHVNFMAGIMADVQQGAIDPIKASMALDDAGPHTLKHLAALAQDPTRKQALGELKAQFGEVTRQADEVRRAAKELQARHDEQSGKPGLDDISEKLNINYKDSPEDIKRQIEALLGFAPSTQASVPEANLQLKRQQLALKGGQQQLQSAKTQQDMVLADVKTADALRTSHVQRKVALKPKPTNGSKPK